MGRVLAKAMGYISYPEILPPTKMASIKTAQAETDTSGREFRIFALKDTNEMQSKPIMRKCENAKPTKTVQKRVQMLQHPVRVQGKLFKGLDNPRITFNGKTHKLPTTKEYLMKEYADVFK